MILCVAKALTQWFSVRNVSVYANTLVIATRSGPLNIALLKFERTGLRWPGNKPENTKKFKRCHSVAASHTASLFFLLHLSLFPVYMCDNIDTNTSFYGGKRALSPECSVVNAEYISCIHCCKGRGIVSVSHSRINLATDSECFYLHNSKKICILVKCTKKTKVWNDKIRRNILFNHVFI